MRYRTPENIEKEVRYLVKNYGVDELWMQDDNALLEYSRAEEIFDRLCQFKVHIRIPCGIRLENLDESLIKKMRRAGLDYVGFGIESGDPDVQRSIHKSLDLNAISEKTRLLNKYGIVSCAFFICGLPGETEEQAERTFRYAMTLPIDRASWNIFNPLPGTETEHETSLIPKEKLVAMRNRFMILFHARPRIIWSLAKVFKYSQLTNILRHPWMRGR